MQPRIHTSEGACNRPRQHPDAKRGDHRLPTGLRDHRPEPCGWEFAARFTLLVAIPATMVAGAAVVGIAGLAGWL